MWDGAKVVCELPITLPTSKVRIKRIIRRDNVEEVVLFPKGEILTTNDYIEWQISYVYNGQLFEFGPILKEFYSNDTC